MDTLLEAKRELSQMSEFKDDLGVYAKKLIECINLEIVHRTIVRVYPTHIEDQSTSHEEIKPKRICECSVSHSNETSHPPVQCTPVSKRKTPNSPSGPIKPFLSSFISSPNGKGKSNFLSRHKGALISLKIKHNSMLNAKEIKVVKLQQDKERRRSEALYRLELRKERDRVRKLRIEQRKRAKVEAEEKRREEEMKIISQMERAAIDATSTTKSSFDEVEISVEEKLTAGAIAAIEVLNQNNLQMFDASDSGSSLASEVDEDDLTQTYSVTESLEIRRDESKAFVNDLRCFDYDGKICEKDSCESSVDCNKDLVYCLQTDNFSGKTRDLNINDSEKNERIPEIVELESQKSTDNEASIWEPYPSLSSELIPRLDDKNTSRSRSPKKGPKLLRLFPTFRSMFSTFVSEGSKALTDSTLKKERECLEYQIKVASSLFEVTDKNNTSKLLFKVKSPREEVNTIIQDVLLSLDYDGGEWEDISDTVGVGNCWNLLWTWSKPKINRDHLLSFQKISRFEGVSCLTRKDLLKKQLERSHPNSNLMPQTFILPHQFSGFISSFGESNKPDKNLNPNIWIMKPVGMSRGRGITLINDIVDVSYARPTVIQKYITNPLLLDGFKFDLRLYILVTSFNPLEAFIYKEGLARFGSRRFSATSIYLHDQQIHLTNSSIQKEYDDEIQYDHPARLAGKNGGGNKTRLSWAFDRLRNNNGIDTQALWREITKLCLRTLQSVDYTIPNQPNSFEVFGFDVIIDAELKPWLIEVNACPSLARESLLDVTVKEAMIRDTITIVQPCQYDREILAQICQRRLHHRKRSVQSNVSDRQQLENDLIEIFGNHTPRLFGQFPKTETDFERIAPSV